MIKQLLTEVRVSSLGVADRSRVLQIYPCCVSELEQGLALDVLDKLMPTRLPADDRQCCGAGPSVTQDICGSRFDWLLTNLENAQLGQQRQQRMQKTADSPVARGEDWSGYVRN